MGAIREIKQKYFGEGDLEAFFGLFGDVFSKIAAIIGVLYFAEGFPADIVMGKILPGIGVGSIAGSLIYFWEAYDLGKKEGRTDVTALPFGVSSTQVFAWIYLIIVPIYRQTGNALHAWQVAVAACFLGGLVEIAGGFVSKLLMKWIPNAALMGNMAAGALVWLSLNGFVTVFETPLVSVIPLFLIFLAQKMKKPLIKGIPNTVLIVGTGVALAWLTGQCNIVALQKSAQTFGVYPPQLSILDVTKGISQIGPYLSIIIPLQIANFLSTMQASESAAMAGDNYPVKRTMILDGVTTVLSSLTGSPFPTTVYYGHPGWKKVGTRSGYSLMMAVVYLSCFFGLPLLILDIIPYEVIIVLLVLVGTFIHVVIPFEIAEEPAVVQEMSELPKENLSGCRILLAEDNELNREIAAFLLKDEGISVTEAEDGQQAVECFLKMPEGYYDAVLMDIMMPVMDGYQAARAIRGSGKKDAEMIPIIAITANAFAEDKRKTMEAGMDAHLSKPLNVQELMDTIRKFCADKQICQ